MGKREKRDENLFDRMWYSGRGWWGQSRRWRGWRWGTILRRRGSGRRWRWRWREGSGRQGGRRGSIGRCIDGLRRREAIDVRVEGRIVLKGRKGLGLSGREGVGHGIGRRGLLLSGGVLVGAVGRHGR